MSDRTQLLQLLAEFARRHATQSSIVAEFSDFVRDHSNCCCRELQIGHITGSAWVASGDGRRVLLTHHKKLNRWLQPGGHADGDTDIAWVALREVREETGLPDLRIEADIFDLDRHWIPAYRDVPGHWHYDVRFVVHATGSEEFIVSNESHALRWYSIDDIAHTGEWDESLRRMARYWMQRL